jgi:hypothetical protein
MSDAVIVGYCRSCGKALDASVANAAAGALYCAEHVPAALLPGIIDVPPPLPAAATINRPTTNSGSPILAFLLGWIPGVGAVYNGQYAKGLVHVLIVGFIISILSNDAAGGLEPLFGMGLACFFFYMAFEAYHTAKAKLEGRPVDEFSSLMSFNSRASRIPIAAILLILFGALFLLNNLDLLDLRRLIRFWPVALIVLGAYLLFERWSSTKSVASDTTREPNDVRF